MASSAARTLPPELRSLWRLAARAGDSVDLTGYQLRSEKGVANGYASLDGTGKVPAAQLPAGSAGVVADAIWDAIGDLAVGTGSDAAARLAKGAIRQILRVGSSTLQWDSLPIEFVDWHGAVGDGSTDDSAAFAAAVAALPSAGGIIGVGPKTYKQNSLWDPAKCVHIMGAAVGSEAGGAAGSPVSKLLFANDVPGIKLSKHWSRISNLHVTGTRTSGTTAIGIDCVGAAYSVLDNVYVENFTKHALDLHDDGGVNNNHIKVYGGRYRNCASDGLHVATDADATGANIATCSFFGVDAYGNGRYNITAGGVRNTFIEPHMASIGVSAEDLRIVGRSGAIINPYSEGAGIAHFVSGVTGYIFFQPGANAKFGTVTTDGVTASTNWIVHDDFGFALPITKLGFGVAPVAKQTITGSRAGNAALASLLTALHNLGLLTNSSTA